MNTPLSLPLDRERIILTYRYLCERGARKFLRPGLERGDLEQVAAIGLIKAYDRYDDSLSTPFEAYAWITITGELMNYLRSHTRTARHFDHQRYNHHANMIDIEERIVVERAAVALSSTERTIIHGIYGLGLKQTEIAAHLALSTRHVGRLHRHALYTLAQHLKEPTMNQHISSPHNGERGFTLLELMVVVAIIAIIAAILVPNFFHARAQAAVSACEANLRAISTAAELYYSDNQQYPTDGVNPVNTAFGDANTTPGRYLSQTPLDPASGGNGYTFQANNTPANGQQSYTITCSGVHDTSALTKLQGGSSGTAMHIFYDSSTGLGAK
jgi:general secretion pathway protein G